MDDTTHDIATTITDDIARKLIETAVAEAKKNIKIFSNYPPHIALTAILGNAIGLVLMAIPKEDVKYCKKYINGIMDKV